MKMKESCAICLLVCIFLNSCGNSKNDPEISDETFPVKFSLRLNEEVIPFNNTRGIPPFDIPEPQPRTKSDTELRDLCCKIEYYVYKEGSDDYLESQSILSDNLDFGEVNIKLPVGNYKVVFIAYSTNVESEVEENIMTFPSGYGDIFHTVYTLKVEPAQKVEKDILLYRIVSKIEFVATDAIPDNMGTFKINRKQHTKQLDLLTGLGVFQSTSDTKLFTIKPEDKGKTGKSFEYLTFVNPQQASVSVTLTAEDTEGEVLRSRDVNNIKPIANRIIRYTGRLYTYSPSDDNFHIDIFENGEWGGTDEIPLEE